MQSDIKESSPLTTTGPGRILVTIITAGKGSSGIYSEAVLQKAASERAFPKGTQMHLDHDSFNQSAEKPEGSLRNLVGVLAEDARYESGALVAEARISSKWRDFIKEFSDSIGVSIAAAADIRDTNEGRIVERIIPNPFNRADFVTVAGRGGRVETVLESARDKLQSIETKTPGHSALVGTGKDQDGNLHVALEMESRETLMCVIDKLCEALNLSTEATEFLTGNQTSRVPASHAHLFEALNEPQQLKFVVESFVPAGKVAELERRTAVAENSAVARSFAKELVTSSNGDLSESAVARIVDAATGTIPLTENLQLDTDTLTETVNKAREAEEIHIAALAKEFGVGQVRGVGESTSALSVAIATDREIADALKGVRDMRRKR